MLHYGLWDLDLDFQNDYGYELDDGINGMMGPRENRRRGIRGGLGLGLGGVCDASPTILLSCLLCLMMMDGPGASGRTGFVGLRVVVWVLYETVSPDTCM